MAAGDHFDKLPEPVKKTVYQQNGDANGLPTALKIGLESLSGLSLDNVRVHYNSLKAVGAGAYAVGNDIHVAPGQERHLPHEAWHVVQQMQGRVKPTAEVSGVPANDDDALSREADVMGAKALSLGAGGGAVQS